MPTRSSFINVDYAIAGAEIVEAIASSNTVMGVFIVGLCKARCPVNAIAKFTLLFKQSLARMVKSGYRLVFAKFGV